MARPLALVVCVACGAAAPPAPQGTSDAAPPVGSDASASDAATVMDAGAADVVVKPGAGYTYAGCPVFGPNGWFDTDVSAAAPDPHSAAYIKATVDAGDTKGFNVWIPPKEKINLATSATPLLTVHPAVTFHSFAFQVPWDATFYIEPEGDAHAMVVDTSDCTLYEFWHATYANGTFGAYSGAKWDMTKPFDPMEYNQGSTASGIPLTAIMVKPEELAAGVIPHAVGWGAIAGDVGENFVLPAHSSGGLKYTGPSTDTPMPYGSHIRLKAAFDDSAFPAAAKALTTALKKYGAFLYDTGCCDEVPFTDDASGAVATLWSAAANGAAISSLHLTDFEVIPPSAM